MNIKLALGCVNGNVRLRDPAQLFPDGTLNNLFVVNWLGFRPIWKQFILKKYTELCIHYQVVGTRNTIVRIG